MTDTLAQSCAPRGPHVHHAAPAPGSGNGPSGQRPRAGGDDPLAARSDHYSGTVTEPKSPAETGGAEDAFQRAVDDRAARIMRWQAAEARLYPLALADPELYEAAVGLVVEAREVLRTECRSGDELAAIPARSVLDRCGSAAAVVQQGFDAQIAVDAARAQRWRELSQASPS